MLSFQLLLAGLTFAGLFDGAVAKSVFAHFIVSNCVGWTQSQWEHEVALAQEAKIDAFVLNIAHGEIPDTNTPQLPNAFGAAAAKGFKVLFSFDYAGGDGGWPKDDVRSLLSQYSGHEAYYLQDGKPIVSTFEGPGAAGDWASIKEEFGIYFIPDWSSLGAQGALDAAPGVLDGLFNWDAWPWGKQMIDTYTDASYLFAMGGEQAGAAKYMMPVSPWFYTNLPGWNKNWAWNGYDLWHNRWQQVLTVQPEFVQVISWNDFGESHYISPVYDSPPFVQGKDRFNYVDGQTHDGWRITLAYYIDLYKTGTTAISEESVVSWYTLHDAATCDISETTINTATQLELEFEPDTGRTIYFSAVLGSVANVTVQVGTTTKHTEWTFVPDGGVGVYHGHADISGLSGEVRVHLVRGNATNATFAATNSTIATIIGKPVGGCGPGGYNNFNPWVGSATSPKKLPVPVSPPLNVADEVCVNGTGVGAFGPICEFNCAHGYCPIGACVCNQRGRQIANPPWQNIQAYARSDPNFSGLCNYACNLGFCPMDVCSLTEQPLTPPVTSPFYPDTCQAGTARDSSIPEPVEELCEFTCKYGDCPIRRCKCDKTGPLLPFPGRNGTVVGKAARAFRDDMIVGQMCSFACPFGGCVAGACRDASSCVPRPARMCRLRK